MTVLPTRAAAQAQRLEIAFALAGAYVVVELFESSSPFQLESSGSERQETHL